MTVFIVSQRSDGRGGFRPFGTYRGSEQGAAVQIGDKTFHVSSDGRVNIPKEYFDKYGVAGIDGRKRIGVAFASKAGTGGQELAMNVQRPSVQKDLDAPTGQPMKYRPVKAADVLEPSDGGEYNFSD